VAENVRADTVIGDFPEGVIDAEVVRIANENLANSNGMDAAETVSGASTDNTNGEGCRKCDLSRVCCSVVSCNILSQGKICDFVNFYLTRTGFASVEPAQASQPYCSVRPAEPNMVTMSSSDTEESLELLLQVPIMVYHLDLWGSTPKNLCQALMLVVTSLRIGPKPKIWS
jgi:hypothetical protein